MKLHHWGLLGLFFFCAVIAQAQDSHFTVAGGLSYANIGILGIEDRKNALGWNATLTADFSRRLGITFDFAGQYDPDCAENDEDCLVDLLLSEQVENYSSYQILAGPQIAMPHGNWSPFAHAMVGGVRTRIETIFLDSKLQAEIESGMRFAMGFGGGLDWNMIPAIGIRVVQADYIPVRYNGNWRHNIRIQGGFLFHF